MECKTYSRTPGKESTSAVACALCGTEKPRLLWVGGGFTFSKCPACGLIYQFPQPKQDELLERYDVEYFSYELQNEANFFSLMWKALEDVGFFRELDLPGGRFLDVGCATGMLLEEMKKRGWEETGVEVCVPSAEYGIKTRGVDIHIGTLEEAKLPRKSFDIVHASHLIEHLTAPGLFLDELFELLKPGGRAIITTPNVRGLQARLFKNRWRSAIADHMYLFSTVTLRRFLNKSGFEVERSKTWGGIAAGIVPSPLKRVVDRSAKIFGFGDVMVFRARKPDA